MALPPPPLLFWALLTLVALSAARPTAANASAAKNPTEVRVGVLLPEHNLRYPWAWPRVGPALSLALEALQPQLSHAGLAVRVAFASTDNQEGTCDDDEVLLKAAQLRSSHDPDVLLLGLGCGYRSDRMSPLAERWQLPLLRADHLRGSASSTTVNAGPMVPDFLAFREQLRSYFNWSACATSVLSRGMECERYYGSSQWSSEEETPYSYGPPLTVNFKPRRGFLYIPSNSREFYICGSLETLHQIMHLAQAQNMTNGDHVFFYLDIYEESLRAEGHREAAKPWQSKESQDMGDLREAFQTVLVITSREPQTPEYRQFQRQLKLRAQRDFGVTLNDSVGHLVAGCFHDGLLLYLRALNETLREGGTKRNTSRILEKMRSLKIQGVTGTVSINNRNERETDFYLWAMRDVESGEYQVVAHYMASKKRINWTGPIHWKKGRPPLYNASCFLSRKYASFGFCSAGQS